MNGKSDLQTCNDSLALEMREYSYLEEHFHHLPKELQPYNDNDENDDSNDSHRVSSRSIFFFRTNNNCNSTIEIESTLL